MEPKHRTLIQAAAIALMIALVVVTHEPPAPIDGAHAELIAHE